MKKPRKAPNIKDLWNTLSLSSEHFIHILEESRKSEREGKYRHWDTLRHIKPPANLTHEEWWLGTKLDRLGGIQKIPLSDKEKRAFSFNVPDSVAKQLHEIDLGAGGSVGIPEPLVNPHIRNQYLVRSLIQESITSSQLEGAAVTREIAKEMLRSGRPPRNKNEQMILNNYLTMQRIQAWKDQALDENLIFEIHRQVTEHTLDHSDAVGRCRKDDETVIVEDSQTKEILHEPPQANELTERLKKMCDFANGKTPSYFIHPVIRAIILHFWLAYDHPFVDGNGRTARALFYWSMLRNGYWLFEYISISEVILKAPSQYGAAFLYTETDDNDLTYFIIHQSEVIQKSLQSLNEYIKMKTRNLEEVEALLHREIFNYRQEALLAHALRHPRAVYTIEEHRTSHGIVYETARQDLLQLHAAGLLEMRKKGKCFVFIAPTNLADLFRNKINIKE